MSSFTDTQCTTASQHLTLLSLGSDNNSLNSLMSIDREADGLIATEGTFLDIFANIWDWGLKNITNNNIFLNPNTDIVINQADSLTLQNSEQLIKYIEKLNAFTTEYKTAYTKGKFKSTTNNSKNELEAITKLLTRYDTTLKTPPTDDIVNKIFDIATNSQDLQTKLNIRINNDETTETANLLNLTPEQAKLFKLEVIGDKVTAKRMKFKKVQRVLENVVSRLRIRKRVLERIKPGATEPITLTVTEQFLDVVHNIDTALTWMDPAPEQAGLTQDEIALEEVELMNIRANINAKLQDLQDSIIALSKKRSLPDGIDEVQSPESTNDIQPSKRTKHDFKCSNVINKCKTSAEPTTPLTPPNADLSPIDTMVTLTTPTECMSDIQTILGKLREAAEAADAAPTTPSVFTFNSAPAAIENDPDVVAIENDPDVVAILASLQNSIKYNESMSSIDLGPSTGGNHKKSHKTTRRHKTKRNKPYGNQTKGSIRRRHNKRGKTAKRMKRSTKKQ